MTNLNLQTHAGFFAYNDRITQYVSPLSNTMGLIVSDIDDVESCRSLICKASYPCAGIAFVHNKRLTFISRLKLTLHLSCHHACPCHIASHHEEAFLWLQQRFQPYYPL